MATKKKTSPIKVEKIVLTKNEIENFFRPKIYFNIYFRMCANAPSNEAAYNATEEMYQETYKRKRYSTYESFTRARRYHLKEGNLR
jgi:hypothetical protein